jgi:APA family basic amino acid/polyamine antiporter
MSRTDDLPRHVTLWGAVAVMAGIMIGSGIFRTPHEIALHMGHPLLILGLWGAGGLLSLLGALTCAELACMYPASGGIYVFLREGFGRAIAFVFGWTYLLVSKPLAAAAITVVLSDHVFQLLGVSFDPQHPDWRARLLTCAVLTLLTIINVLGVRLSTSVAKVLTGIKVAGLAAIVLIAIAVGKGSPENWTAAPTESALLPALGAAMTAILWTYDGWSDVGGIAGEIRDPQRTIPRAFLLGTLAVTGLYVVVNAVYLWIVPLERMRDSDMATVAPRVMEMLAGPAGATFIVVLIIISTLGSSHGAVLTGARVSFAQARDGLLFELLGQIHPRYATPAAALWTQLVLSCAAVLFVGTFGRLASGFVFTMWMFYGLAGAALFAIRRRGNAPRPAFRCPGYPVVPALFVVSAAAMTVGAFLSEPVASALWLGVLAAGFPAYWVWKRIAPANTP